MNTIDKALEEMIRDFTAVGKPPKSEVRRRLNDLIVQVRAETRQEDLAAIEALRSKGSYSMGVEAGMILCTEAIQFIDKPITTEK